MIFDHDNNTIWIRQSWLGTALRCTERGRLSMVAPEWDRGSDSTHLGTSVHYGIEQYLRGAIGLEDLEACAIAYEEANRPVEMTWKKMDGYAHLQRNLRNDMAAFREHIAPHVPLGGRAEQSFALPLYERSDGWTVGIQGTVDYVAPNAELWDWKTSSRPYKPYEKQRYEVQPSIYALAAVRGALGDDSFQLPIRFNYGVMEHMAKRARPQIVTVIRHQSHIDWALDRIADLINLALTMGTDITWPRDDDHFLCNETWCPWWSICKGARITAAEDRHPDQIQLDVS